MASIANMLTITRIHNSVAAAAAMRRHADTPTTHYFNVLFFFFITIDRQTDYLTDPFKDSPREISIETVCNWKNTLN